MNPSNEPATAWSDEQIDALLGEFFRHEVPAQLRHPRPFVARRPPADAPRLEPVALASGRPIPSDRPSGGAVGILVAVAALAMTVVLTIGAGTFDHRRPDGGAVVGSRSDAAGAIGSAAAPAEVSAAPLGPALVIDRVERRLEPVARATFQTDRGPVEQRTELRTTNVSAFDAATGTTVELEVPELSIEIIPFEDDE